MTGIYIMKELTAKIRNTPSYQEFINSGKKQLSEDEYSYLCNRCIDQIDEEKPDRSKMGVLGNMAWFSPRQKAFRRNLNDDGIRIRWDSEFEDRLRDYINEQGPNPGIGPIGKTEWYSQKRKELEDIMTREDNDVGC